MAKKPNQKATQTKGAGRTRHSKAAKKPVTIEHDAKDAKVNDTSKTDTPRRSVPSSKAVGDTAKASAASSAAKMTAKQPDVKDAPDAASKAAGTTSSTGSPNTKPTSSGTSSPAKVSASSGNKGKGGRGSTLLAACVGGIVALGLAGLLQYVGILSTPGVSEGSEASAQLESRIAGLEEKLSAQPTAGSTDETVAKLIDERLSAQSASSEERIAAVEGSVAQLRDQFGSLPAGTSMDAATVARINELAEEVATLKSGSTVASSDTITENSVSAARLGELAKAAEQIRTDLNAQIESMSVKLEKTNAEQAETNVALAETNAKLQETLAKTSQTNTEITALRDRVENGADKRAATAIAAAALKSDIDSGSPFAAALSNLKAFSPGMTELENLDSFAQKGVPTVTQLTTEFENSVSDAILVATAPVEDGSLASRLAAGARSLVKVRRLGVAEGETPEARVSQIAGALKNGDLSKASEIWDILPDTGREASADWYTRLQARLTANSIVNGTVEDILNSSRDG